MSLSSNRTCAGGRIAVVIGLRTTLVSASGWKIACNFLDRVTAVVTTANQIHGHLTRWSSSTLLNYLLFIDRTTGPVGLLPPGLVLVLVVVARHD